MYYLIDEGLRLYKYFEGKNVSNICHRHVVEIPHECPKHPSKRLRESFQQKQLTFGNHFRIFFDKNVLFFLM